MILGNVDSYTCLKYGNSYVCIYVYIHVYIVYIYIYMLIASNI